MIDFLLCYVVDAGILHLNTFGKEKGFRYFQKSMFILYFVSCDLLLYHDTMETIYVLIHPNNIVATLIYTCVHMDNRWINTIQMHHTLTWLMREYPFLFHIPANTCDVMTITRNGNSARNKNLRVFCTGSYKINAYAP